jgi:hypothetical protein
LTAFISHWQKLAAIGFGLLRSLVFPDPRYIDFLQDKTTTQPAPNGTFIKTPVYFQALPSNHAA